MQRRDAMQIVRFRVALDECGRCRPVAVPHLREINVNTRTVVTYVRVRVRLLPLSDARGARRLLRKQYCLDTITRRNRDRPVE